MAVASIAVLVSGVGGNSSDLRLRMWFPGLEGVWGRGGEGRGGEGRETI